VTARNPHFRCMEATNPLERYVQFLILRAAAKLVKRPALAGIYSAA